MTVTFVQRGESIDYTPSSDVSAGDVVVLGDLVGVAKLDIQANTLGALAVSGVFDFPKATGVGSAIARGVLVYWDAADLEAKADDEEGANKLLGATILAATDDDETVRVLLLQGDFTASVPQTDAIDDVDDVTAAAQDLTASDPELDASDVDDQTGGTPDASHQVVDVSGSDTVSEANVEANFATLAAEYNALKDDVEANEGSLEAAIDDLATQKAELDKLIADVTADKAKINAILAGLREIGLVSAV